ncbi:MAG: hypothetical protein AMJ90_04225 [candidate division Zixibacteria bacterium SM23_73_2]|nr:MAG: hypothetical protein AMJ90_04225 [candidate division Zixibacteria bacterium SM23_73_2]
MKKILTKILIFFLLVIIPPIIPASTSFDSKSKISPDLLTKLNQLNRNEFESFLIVFKDQLNTDYLDYKLSREAVSFSTRHRTVISSLRNLAKSSQKELIGILEKEKEKGKVKKIRSFWVSNVLSLKATKEVIEKISQRDDIEILYPDYPISLIEPVSESPSLYRSKINRNWEAINLRKVWEMGYTGLGRLVCNFDTGVDGDHPALGERWRGNNGGSFGASWYDPFGTTHPCDGSGHGTHTMGIMAGGTEFDTIGVAFKAQWIAAAVVDRGKPLSATISDILAAFQWACDPDEDPETIHDVPDVVNNSWGIPFSVKPPCDQTFWNAIDNLEACGVVCLFSCGNEGPDSLTIRTPADRISSPTNTFSVGAVDGITQEFTIAPFSSRGPSRCDNHTIKPEVCAPGVNIRSSHLNGGYKIMSGTSMASPFVAGACAILKQFNPEATVEQIKLSLLNSAKDLGPQGEDNLYGHGLMDLKKALEYMPPPQVPRIHIDSFYVDKIESLTPDTFNLFISLKNWGSSPSNIQAILSTEDTTFEIQRSSVYYGRIEHGEKIWNSEPFVLVFDPPLSGERRVDLTLDISGENQSFSGEAELHIDLGAPLWMADHDVGNYVFTLSNKGVYGLAEGSISPLGGKGFCYPKSGENHLYEAALLFGNSSQRVSDGLRDSSGQNGYCDFLPLYDEISVYSPGLFSDQEGIATFSDQNAETPLGIEVTQRSFSFSDPSDDDYLILEFALDNKNSEPVDSFYLGLFFDWDIPFSSPEDDKTGVDSSISLAFQYDPLSNLYLGVLSLNFPACGISLIDNQTWLYNGFSEYEKYLFLSGKINTPADTASGDWSVMLSCGPFDINSDDSIKVAFAVVGGMGFDHLKDNAMAAKLKYFELSTGVEEEEGGNLPERYTLSQNYPNPFNPFTTISFSVHGKLKTENGPIHTSLDIYNVLGQRVRTLVNENKLPGEYKVIWDGKDDSGEDVSSGVYFYRLRVEDGSEVKKMVLVK